MSSRRFDAKKWAFYACFALVLAVVSLVAGIYTKQHVMFWDHPRSLSDSTQTIEVSYIAWACDCANWLPANTVKEGEEIKEEDCIFIEPASPGLEVPDSFYNKDKTLLLTGSFYNKKGIPKGYDMNTEDKPEKGRVFRYTGIKIINAKD